METHLMQLKPELADKEIIWKNWFNQIEFCYFTVVQNLQKRDQKVNCVNKPGYLKLNECCFILVLEKLDANTDF